MTKGWKPPQKPDTLAIMSLAEAIETKIKKDDEYSYHIPGELESIKSSISNLTEIIARMIEKLPPEQVKYIIHGGDTWRSQKYTFRTNKEGNVEVEYDRGY